MLLWHITHVIICNNMKMICLTYSSGDTKRLDKWGKVF